MSLLKDIYAEVCRESGINFEEHFLSYPELEEALEGFLELYDYRVEEGAEYEDAETVTVLYALAFGLKSLSVASKEQAGFSNAFLCSLKCLLASISNTSLSICVLLKRGLYHDAAVLFRNLNEQCLILLNILIDEEKRNAYISNNELIMKRGVWKKYFSFSSLNETLRKYEEMISKDGLANLSAKRAKSYSWHSSSVHNGFGHLFRGIYIPESLEKEDPFLEFNLGGMPNERIIWMELQGLNDQLFYTMLVMRRVVNSNEGTINPANIVSHDHYEMWDQSQSVSYFAERQLFRAKMKYEEVFKEQFQ